MILGPPEGDTDAGGDEHLLPTQQEGDRQLLLNPIGHPQRVCRFMDGVEQDGELITPEACQGMLGPHASDGVGCAGTPQSAAQLDQELIPGEVAKAVIDHLEPIEVQEQDGEPGVRVPIRPLDGALEPVHEQDAVRQAGQGIGHLALGDIGQRAGHAQAFAVAVPDGDGATVHPAIGPVLVQQPVFALEMRGVPLAVGGELRTHPRGVLGVDAV